MIRIGFSLPFVIGLTIVSSCRQSTEPPDNSNRTAQTTASATASAPAGLRVVEPSQVCMVNNRYMGSAQIPTEVDGRTYYGCCPMCSERLRGEQSVRTAKDPVSGEVVDKATTIIAANESGNVLYFKNAKTLAAYHR